MRPEMLDFSSSPVRAFVWCIEHAPYHWHDALEIVQVLQGSLEMDLGNDHLVLCENDIAVVNRGELHRIRKGGAGNRVLFIQVDPRCCQTVLPTDQYSFIYCCSVYHEAASPEKYQRMREMIAHLVRATLASGGRSGQEAVNQVLTIMLRQLAEEFDLLRWGLGTTAFDDRRVSRLKQIAALVNEDPGEGPGLTQLAAATGVSLQYLSNDIKQKFGLTFQELLYYGKCEQAAKLLLGTNARIVDIALECGFSDPKYLIKHFKHFFSCTPSGFRKLHKADESTLASELRYLAFPLGAFLGTE